MSEKLTKTVERMSAIRTELEQLATQPELGDEDQAYFDELGAEWSTLNEERIKLEREDLLERVRQAPEIAFNGTEVKRGDGKPLDDDPLGEPEATDEAIRFENPWDLSGLRTFGRSGYSMSQELRARAFSAIQRLQGANQARKETMTRFVQEHDDKDNTMAKLVLLTSSPAYMRAFSKYLADKMHTLDDKERDAVTRAMSLTDSEGGFLIPFQLDPTVIITTDGTMNDIRRAARVVVATGDVWNGVSSGAVSWSWDAEAAQVSDDTTTFAQPSVTVHKAAGFVPMSFEIFADIPNQTAEIGRLLAAGKDNLEATAFATGSGSGQPYGIVTAITATTLTSATTDTFALADVYTLDETLPARHRPNASWLANRAIYNDIRQFDTSGGAALWERLGADVPALLLGRPAYEAEAMDGTVNAGAENYVLIFGDFSNYVVADRLGMQVELIPHLFGTANNRPTGQRGLYAYYRTGADSVYDGAFEMMNVT